MLADIDGRRYDAIVIPGGHGPVEDLYKGKDMSRILAEADRAGSLIAPVCHIAQSISPARLGAPANSSRPRSNRPATCGSHTKQAVNVP